MRGSVRPRLRDGQKQISKRTGEPIWRLTYDVGRPGEKRQQNRRDFTGTLKAAQAELRRLIADSNNPQIDPNNIKVGDMLDDWLK